MILHDDIFLTGIFVKTREVAPYDVEEHERGIWYIRTQGQNQHQINGGI